MHPADDPSNIEGMLKNFDINIKIASPMLIIPFNSTND